MQELPHRKKIVKEFAGQPLVVIRVSLDSNPLAWRQLVERHEMTWVQYRDADHKLAGEFVVESIPHYFTVGSDGALTSEMMGEESNIEGRLRKLIAQAG
ncbi:MAG: peroxiredoxin family protein [Acidobacteriaceae bacterium]